MGSDSTTDEEDGRERLEEEYYSDASDVLEKCWSGEDSGEGIKRGRGDERRGEDMQRSSCAKRTLMMSAKRGGSNSYDGRS